MSAPPATTAKGLPKIGDTPGAIRRAIEDRIERLIAMLDTMDGELDDEETDFGEDDAGDAGELDEDREPALGWTENERQTFGPARFGDVSLYDEDEEFSLGERGY